jgi:hypothetical protein
VVSTSKLSACLPSTTLTTCCFVFFSSFSWTWKCLMIAGASLMVVSVVM